MVASPAVGGKRAGEGGRAMLYEDEFVRHKILDAIRDLSLVGYPIIGHLVAHRAGHALHTAFAKRVLEDADAWKLVELAPEPAAVLSPAAVTVKA